MEHNGWGLTKFKKYQMKKIKKTFFKFCLSPCYPSVLFFSFFLGREKKKRKLRIRSMLKEGGVKCTSLSICTEVN